MRQAGSSTCWRGVLWSTCWRCVLWSTCWRCVLWSTCWRCVLVLPPPRPRARRASKCGISGISTCWRGVLVLRCVLVLLRQQVLRVYRQKLADFGLTFACEKLAGRDGPAPKSRYPATLADGRGSVAQATPTRAAPQPPAGLDGAASANWCRWTPPSMTGWRAVATAWC